MPLSLGLKQRLATLTVGGVRHFAAKVVVAGPQVQQQLRQPGRPYVAQPARPVVAQLLMQRLPAIRALPPLPHHLAWMRLWQPTGGRATAVRAATPCAVRGAAGPHLGRAVTQMEVQAALPHGCARCRLTASGRDVDRLSSRHRPAVAVAVDDPSTRRMQLHAAASQLPTGSDGLLRFPHRQAGPPQQLVLAW